MFKPKFSAIAQLRAGHSPLLTFLYRINAADSPNCRLSPKSSSTDPEHTDQPARLQAPS
ncbi:hypothetical protein CROQUDRAFT_95299 [Cronartium quercuum f. sp. fusiforme G11]|uniref:Uncharacterized protein n=1 Tax=Cronartium quercuum f. sp. fusiforme G11 TaxID=708437 RepID=A0A9P6NDN7_9BASI|nr:hypothetical protein CROQUDRAFT_95299 [Cronartium quercuum f. sp. fusiforme G11]